MAKHPLDGDIVLKIARANEHLEAVRRMVAGYEEASCEVVVENDLQADIGWLTLRLPKPDRYLSILAGDCLYNLRSALDHLVWQLVLSNPPNRPTRHNMFPICTSMGAFEEQIQKGRLKGVTEPAVALIKGLQPGDDRGHPLFLLDKLHNIDKHRELNLVIAVASDLHLKWTRQGIVTSESTMANEDIHDGARLIGFPLSDRDFRPVRDEMKVYGEATTFVAFKDVAVADDNPAPIQATLERIREFLIEAVIEPLEPFLKQ
jgi:hypothetical protein